MKFYFMKLLVLVMGMQLWTSAAFAMDSVRGDGVSESVRSEERRSQGSSEKKIRIDLNAGTLLLSLFDLGIEIKPNSWFSLAMGGIFYNRYSLSSNDRCYFYGAELRGNVYWNGSALKDGPYVSALVEILNLKYSYIENLYGGYWAPRSGSKTGTSLGARVGYQWFFKAPVSLMLGVGVNRYSFTPADFGTNYQESEKRFIGFSPTIDVRLGFVL